MEHSPNIFDLGVLIVVGLSALLSFYRGFVREVLSLGGWIVASLVTLRFLEPASAYIKPQVHSDVLSSGIAAVGLFFITLIVVSILSGILLKILKPGDRVGLLDNLVGLCFGVARGVLIVTIAFFIMNIAITEKDYPQWLKTSYTRPYVQKCAKWIASLTPEYLDQITKKSKASSNDSLSDASKKAVNEMIKKLDKTRDEAVKKVDNAAEKVEEESEDLPSLKDLQERIKEENERR